VAADRRAAPTLEGDDMGQCSQTSRTAWQVAWAAAASLALFVAGVAKAEPPPPRDWDLSLDLYGWIPATNLDIETHVDGQNFSRNFDKHLDDAFEDLDGGGGGDLRFRWKRLVGYLDGAWVQSDENGKGWFTNTIIDGKVGFRLLDMNAPFSSPTAADAHRFTLDLLAGARYRKAETDLDIETPFRRVTRHNDRDWVDPLVGLAWEVGLWKNLSLWTVADIGGFSAWDSSSSLAWSINPRLEYRAWDHLNLFIGWKHLSEDHDDIDLDLTGPQAGIGYVF
jgi:hypothetical protein